MSGTDLLTEPCLHCSVTVVTAYPDEQYPWIEVAEGGCAAFERLAGPPDLLRHRCYLVQSSRGDHVAVVLRAAQVPGARSHGQVLYREHRCPEPRA